MATQYTAGLAQGQKLTAAIMNQIGATWEAYTPALTASVTNPTLGTGSTTYGYYTRIQKFVMGIAYFAFGSAGTSAGSGDYYISLPVSATTTAGQNIITGYAWLYDASAAAGWSAISQTYTATTAGFYKSTGDATITIGSGNPFAWAANDQFRYEFIYQAA